MVIVLCEQALYKGKVSTDTYFPFAGSAHSSPLTIQQRNSLAALLAVALALTGLTRAGFVVSDNTDNAADPNSLRYAIDHVTSGNNSITFASSLAGQTITLTNGELRVNQNVT